MEEKNYHIERYCKRPKGRIYRDVRFYVDGHVVEVCNLLTKTDELALQIAKELLNKALQ